MLIDGTTVIASTDSLVASRKTTVSLSEGEHMLRVVRTRGPDGTYAIHLTGATRPSGAKTIYGQIEQIGGYHQFNINVP